MFETAEHYGEYPIAEPWPEFEAVQTEPYDTPDLLIAQGNSHYTTMMARALERQTGDRATYLTADQEYELAQKLERGRRATEFLTENNALNDEQRVALEHDVATAAKARETLILANLRLAAFYARASMNIISAEDRETKRVIGAYADITHLASSYATLDDRIGMANEGLIHAVDKFKPHISPKSGKPVRFSTFATWPIHQSISRGVKATEHSGIRLSDHTVEVVNAVRKGKEVDPDTLAKYALYHQRNASRIPFEALTVSHFDTDRDNDNWDARTELELSEVAFTNDDPTPETRVDDLLLTSALDSLLDSLSEREAGVIRMRFGLAPYLREMTLDEIGDAFGVTRERVRQIESKTMAKLRHPSRSESVRDYIINEPPIVQEAGFTRRLNFDYIYDAMPFQRHASSDGAAAANDRETWQTDSGEDWEAPVFSTPESATDDSAVMAELNEIIRSQFVDAFQTVEHPDALPSYPVDLLSEVRDAVGSKLAARHVEALWNETLPELLDQFSDANVDPTRLGLMVSALLCDTLRDDDEVRLEVPALIDGRIDYFGSGLRHGHVIVSGNLGDYAGARMRGIGSLEIYGSVGDDAGARMKDFSTLLVHGNAGYRFGEASETAQSTCEGTQLVDEYVPEVVVERPTIVKREVSRSDLTIASLRSRIRAQENMLESLEAIGDAASAYQVDAIYSRLETLRLTLKRAEQRRYWDTLRRGTFTSKPKE